MFNDVLLVSLFFVIVFINSLVAENIMECVKKPSGTETPATKADGRFSIEVSGAIEKKFLPGNNYTVQLKADDNSAFTSFMIMADGEYVQDKTNPRNHYYHDAGVLRPKNGSVVPTQIHPTCHNTVKQSSNAPKNFVEVEWIAPGRNQGCVTIHAMVVESQEVWYMDDGPLTYRICEDTRKMIDIEPIPISECGACEEAKYELTFEGQWSRNTHPQNFPGSASRRFSDVVGASHSSSYYLWDYNYRATPGLKLLAETGNTTVLEQEIQSKFDSGVRTLIKANGKSGNHISNPTTAIFRADSTNHLMSIASSINPSPDWFVGVTHFELCFENNTWVTDRELNLYLTDAGTDNGVSYESSNEETLPPGIIKRVREISDNINSPFYSLDPRTPRHFAKIRVRLLRVYREKCGNDYNAAARTLEFYNGQEDITEDNTQDTTQIESPVFNEGVNPPIQVGSCLMTDWKDWSQCEPACGDERYRTRERYFVVDGIEIRYHKENPSLKVPDVPRACKDYVSFDMELCDPLPCE